MTDDVAWRALGGLLSVLTLLWLLYGPIQSLIVSWARSEMFAVRDELFNLAMEGYLSFDSETYKSARISINQSIRFHHKMTWLRLLVLRSVTGPVEKSVQPLECSIKQIKDPELQAVIKKKMKRMSDILFYSLILRSPVLLLSMPLIAIVYLTMSVFTNSKANIKFQNVRSEVNKNIQADIRLEAGIHLGRARKAFG